MPLHAVKQDLLEGRLAKLSIEDLAEESLILPMSAVYLTAKPPGPAGRWLIERLKQCSGQRAADQQAAQSHLPAAGGNFREGRAAQNG
jgi:DNA-binding transcriptional LysR family regulator